jgi:ABC-type Mn2+/Zn2+ transport system ATPase subunit
MTSDTLITVKHLSVMFEDTEALHDVSFSVERGDYVALIGPNGAGKSTLIRAIVGLVTPARGGEVHVQGGIGRLGYVPQHNAVDWSFPVSVRDVVLMGLTRQIGWLRPARKVHHARVDEALQRAGLLEMANRQIGDLSGGLKRRVFIARALAQQADILLLDEPFAGVDIGAQNELMDLLDALNAQGITIVLSTHDLALAFSRFKKVLAVNHRMLGYGKPSDIYTPDMLRELYGGRVATWQEDKQTLLFIDDHAHS